MRLHSLTLSAFGSFSGRDTVDFDQLSATGLFLLHGPTGAGKTTILDAVSYALFGTVPGVRSAGEALRSHHASGDAVTEVELEVTLDGRRYRIVRRPKQQRPKQRGEGLREHPSYATVEELVAGGWVVRASKPSEADPYLQDHLHMEADQFHQIVMLPQGDFARFLRASADERRKALEDLFGTHRFTEVERWLRTQADDARRALRDADEHARRILAAAATVADVAPFDDDRPLSEASAWLTDLTAAADRAHQQAAGVELARRTAHDQARAVLADAVELRTLQSRHAAAEAQQRTLAAATSQQEAGRARRDLALRAAPLVPLLGAVTRTSDDRRRLARARVAAAGALDRVAPHLGGATLDELERHDEHLIGQRTIVSHLLDDEQSLRARQQHVADLDEQQQRLTGQRIQLAETLEHMPRERDRLDEQLAAAGQAASRLPDLVVLEAQLATRAQAALERDRLVALVQQQTIATAAARSRALDARERWLELLQRQLAGQAAAMAAELQPGDSCPVCGSAEHPHLAAGDGQVVTDADVAQARQLAERADQALQATVQAAADLDQQLAAVTATAGPSDREAADLAAELVTLQGALADARAQAAAEPDLRASRERIDDQIERMTRLVQSADDELVAIRHDREVQASGLDAVRQQVLEARDGFPTLAARTDAIDATRAAIAAAIAADQACAQAEQAHATAVEAAEAEAHRRSFADLAAAESAILDDDQLDELSTEIEAHDLAVADTRAALADPLLIAAAALAPAPVSQLEDDAHAAERDWDVASTATATTRDVVDKLARCRGALDDRLVGLDPLTEAYDRARHLADLASGDDRQVEHRMRLSTYVLAARLEQVAAAASHRLSRMSGGRFTIVHTDEAPDGRRKGGLGLRVVDAWTSTHRETASLSGGESFFTSLALALGVADIVSAEAGGITIDTMFIDEGFGSLDEDTLQQVLDVIDTLRAGGRTIGIVSHVADLRDRITTQLEVIKGSDGSSLRTTAPTRTTIGDPRFDRTPAAPGLERPDDVDAAGSDAA